MNNTPLKAIRLFCLTCAGRPKDVRLCSNTSCFLFEYRMGHNENRKGIGGRKPRKQPILPSNTLTQVNNPELNQTGGA